MDSVGRRVFEMAFELAFLKRRGGAFQDFFSSIMEKCHPGDFIRTRPWGHLGDRKNDGYLSSERTLFQCYAPDEMRAAEAIAKIDRDFNGALPYWREYFDKWVFVHNARDGLGPHVVEKLLALGRSQPSLTVLHWGYEELLRKLFTLSDEQISSVLKFPGVTQESLLRFGFEELMVVVLSIAQAPPDGSGEVRAVPVGKLEANALPQSVRAVLQLGMTRAKDVGGFFKKWHDKELGERVAERFRRKYSALRDEGLAPYDIFHELHKFAGSEARLKPEHEVAVLAVLAFLFEQCDIFEPARDS